MAAAKRVGFSPLPTKTVDFNFSEADNDTKQNGNNDDGTSSNNNSNNNSKNNSKVNSPSNVAFNEKIAFNNFTSNIKLVEVDDEASLDMGNADLNRYNARTPSFSVSMWSTKSAYHMLDEHGNKIKRPKTPAIIRHARMDSVSEIKQLIEDGKEMGIDIINTIDINTGKTPLIQAAMFGNLKTLEFLINEQKADVNYVPTGEEEDDDEDNENDNDDDDENNIGIKKQNNAHLINQNKSALQWAISRQHYDVIELLLKHGANMAHQDIEGWTSLHYSVFKRDLKITRMLLDRDKKLLNIKDEFGYTALERLIQWIQLQESMTSKEKENIDNLLDLLTGNKEEREKIWVEEMKHIEIVEGTGGGDDDEWVDEDMLERISRYQSLTDVEDGIITPMKSLDEPQNGGGGGGTHVTRLSGFDENELKALKDLKNRSSLNFIPPNLFAPNGNKKGSGAAPANFLRQTSQGDQSNRLSAQFGYAATGSKPVSARSDADFDYVDDTYDKDNNNNNNSKVKYNMSETAKKIDKKYAKNKNKYKYKESLDSSDVNKIIDKKHITVDSYDDLSELQSDVDYNDDDDDDADAVNDDDDDKIDRGDTYDDDDEEDYYEDEDNVDGTYDEYDDEDDDRDGTPRDDDDVDIDDIDDDDEYYDDDEDGARDDDIGDDDIDDDDDEVDLVDDDDDDGQDYSDEYSDDEPPEPKSIKAKSMPKKQTKTSTKSTSKTKDNNNNKKTTTTKSSSKTGTNGQNDKNSKNGKNSKDTKNTKSSKAKAETKSVKSKNNSKNEKKSTKDTKNSKDTKGAKGAKATKDTKSTNTNSKGKGKSNTTTNTKSSAKNNKKTTTTTTTSSNAAKGKSTSTTKSSKKTTTAANSSSKAKSTNKDKSKEKTNGKSNQNSKTDTKSNKKNTKTAASNSKNSKNSKTTTTTTTNSKNDNKSKNKTTSGKKKSSKK